MFWKVTMPNFRHNLIYLKANMTTIAISHSIIVQFYSILHTKNKLDLTKIKGLAVIFVILTRIKRGG